MLKKIFLAFMGVITGVFSAPLSSWISGDEKSHLLSWRQLVVSTACFIVFTTFVYLLESAQAIDWNWRWHRFWFFQEVLEGDRPHRLPKMFRQPDAVENVSVAEVDADGARKNLVDLLLERYKRKAGVGHVLVVGEPGSGKSVALEHLRSRLAQQGAKRFGVGTPIPVLVLMGGYRKGKILEHVKEIMGSESKTAAKLSKGLERLLKQGKVVLLLDALDEALGRNPEAAEEVEDLLTNYQYEHARVVVTGRRGEYEKHLPADMEIFEVQDLSDAGVLSLIQFNHVKVKNPPAATEVMSSLSAAGLLDDGALGRNPFWLGLMVQGGTFENNKAKILDSAVSALLKREWDKENSKRLWKRTLSEEEQLQETREGLTRLAYQISISDKGEEIDGEQAIKIINDYLSGRVGISGLRPQDIVWLGRDAQLIDFNSFDGKKGWQRIRFRHRLIREYLTAYELSKEGTLAIKAISEYSPDVRWWDTLLMLGSLKRGDKLTDDHRVVVQAAMGDGADPRRLMLASAMLESDWVFDRPLLAATIAPLAVELRKGVTGAHIEAAAALADIAPGKLVNLLHELVKLTDADLQPMVADLLRKLLSDESTGEKRSNLIATLIADHALRDISLPILVCIGKPLVAPLIRVLGDSSFIVRWHAADALGQIKDAEAVVPLIMLLDDPNDTVRRAAVQALGYIGDVRALVPIARALNPQDDRSTRDYLMNAAVLRALGDLGKPAIDELIRMLRLQDITIWVFASSSLTQIGRPAVRPLIRALGQGSRSFFFYRQVIDILGDIGDEEAVEPLIRFLGGRDVFLNVSVSRALIKLGESAVRPLISLLEDENMDVRQKAANILGRMKSKQAVGPLIALLRNRASDERKNQEEALARSEAAEALGNIGDEAAVEPLREAAQEDRLLVGLSATASLVKLGDEGALKILHSHLIDYNDASDPSGTASVHFIVAQYLGELKRSQSLAYLEKFLGRQSDTTVADKKWVEELTKARREAHRSIEKIIKHLLNAPGESRSGEDESDADKGERDLRMYSDLLTHHNESVRGDAVAALTQTGEPGLNLLIQALANDNPDARKHAVVGLGIIKSESVVGPLIKTLQTDTDNVVRKLAAETLSDTGDARAIAPLRLALEDSSLIVKIGAATALGQLGEVGMLDLLHSLSSGKVTPAMSFTIARAYEKIGDPNALPFLEELLAQTEEDEQIKGFKIKDVIASVMNLLKATHT